MDKTEQRIKIAEACGWKPHPDNKTRNQKFWSFEGQKYGDGHKTAAMPEIPEGFGMGIRPLPDYLNDLNAMHEAERVLNGEQLGKYRRLLSCFFTDHPDDGYHRAIHATAEQRVEAFLRTLGLWKEVEG